MKVPMKCQDKSHEQQQCSKIQGMNNHKSKKRVHRKGKQRETKKPDLVQPTGSLGKTQPPEGEREGNRTRENDSPEDALVCHPAVQPALTDKLLRKQIEDCFRYKCGVATKILVGEE